MNLTKFNFTPYPLLTIILLSVSTFAQNFNQLNTQNLKGGYLGFSSFVDYNNDGLLDIFTTGLDFDNRYTNAVFYENNGDLSFTESTISIIPRVIYGDYSWGDYDNDGALDLLYTGTTSGFDSEGISKIYRNTNNGCDFIELQTMLPGISRGTCDWVDMNNDSLLDIFLIGFNQNGELIAKAYQNNTNDDFGEQNIIGIDLLEGDRANFSRNEARWEDLDGDGLKDLVLALSTDLDFTLEVYKNLGDFQFSKQNIGLPKLSYVAMEIGDINNDGLQDIVFTGSPNLENSSGDGTGDFYVFTNNNNMNFNNSFSIANEGVFFNDIELGDFDNDGFLDAINYGTGPWGDFPEVTKIYKNNGNGTFSDFSHNLPDCRFGGIDLGDFDNDNDLDILYFGRIEDPSDNEITYIYKNSFANIDLPSEILTSQSCICDNTINFSLNNSYDSVSWDFGDPSSGSLNVSSDKNVSHLFSDFGSYTVSATYTKGSTTATITKLINIIELPEIQKPEDLVICETIGVNQFNFNDLNDLQILNGASTDDFEVFYYTSLENAQENRYRLSMPYNFDSDVTIYSRVQSRNNSNCFKTTEFNVSSTTNPIANPVDDLMECDNNNDGFATFDLSQLETMVIGNQSNVETVYFNNLNEIIPKDDLDNYENISEGTETITIRVLSTLSECFEETTTNLIVNSLPRANELDVIIACDDNGDGISNLFDTSMVEETVLDNQTGMEITYFDNNGNEFLNLDNPFSNTIPFQETIVVRVTNTISRCYSETELLLRTEAQINCSESSEETADIIYPKFFTPNDDGYNDYWQIKGTSDFSNYKISIFDRYGKLLKQISGSSIGWDGTYNGKQMETNDYWFKVDFNNTNITTGHFSLKR